MRRTTARPQSPDPARARPRAPFRPLQRLARFLPHLCVAMSLSLLTLIVIDRVNNAMGFLAGDVFHVFLAVYLVVAAATAGVLIRGQTRG
jgi:hypothetical protein